MTHKYQNTGFTTGKSSFVDVESQPANEVTFTSRRVNATVVNGPVPMVKASVTLRSEVQATQQCGNDCPPTVVEQVKMDFSIEQGAERLAALRSEVNRLLDEAIDSYGITKGLVPPVYATFVEEA